MLEVEDRLKLHAVNIKADIKTNISNGLVNIIMP